MALMAVMSAAAAADIVRGIGGQPAAMCAAVLLMTRRKRYSIRNAA